MFEKKDKAELKMNAANTEIDKLKLKIEGLESQLRRERYMSEISIEKLTGAHEIAVEKLENAHEAHLSRVGLGFEKEIMQKDHEFKTMESEKETEAMRLRMDLNMATAERTWVVEQARQEVRNDLEYKCTQADLRMVKAEARADATEAMLMDYKQMANDAKVAEKALDKAMAVLSRAVTSPEIKVINRND